jgi:heavy metal translocating P-type ATPase
MKKYWEQLVRYKLFSIALIVFIISLALEFTPLKWISRWLLSALALGEVVPLLWGMYRDVREGTYGVDLLAATAIVTSVIMKQYWAGVVIVLMLTGGEALEDYAEGRAKTELEALLKNAPQHAHVLKNNVVMDVPIARVLKNQKIVIRPGEVVPVDCLIIEGSSSFDESSLTGESLPQEKNINDELLSGTVNLEGAITAKTIRPAAESQYEQIIKLVKSASSSKAGFVRLADRYSIPFTIISFVIAIAAWVISGHSIRFLEVLVVATPCPLILAAPIAIISGMSKAAKNGIIIKTGSALEKLAEAKTIGFDKTGTLTEGRPVVKKVTSYKPFMNSEVLTLAASLELNSNHVLAKAIINEASRLKLKTKKAKKIIEVSGKGLSAHVSGKTVLVGRVSLMEENDVNIPKGIKLGNIKDTSTYVAINNELAGVISFEDQVRKESKNTLKKLRLLGLKNILMVTGDSLSRARVLGKQLGIDQIEAEALPADKLIAIERIKERPVVFVGDGVNDAPVLTAADVGIALGARGSTAASQSADMVIMLDDVSKVATVREIAVRTFFIAKQSIFIGIGLSVGLMLIFSTGRFLPVYGAVIQELVDVVVIFNALRAHGSWKRL